MSCQAMMSRSVRFIEVVVGIRHISDPLGSHGSGDCLSVWPPPTVYAPLALLLHRPPPAARAPLLLCQPPPAACAPLLL